MSDHLFYPECLRRTDLAGHVQTRTPETEDDYRTRFNGMIRTLCRKHRWQTANAHDLALDLAERAARYTADTLKQYHAAIRQNLRDRWNADMISLEEIEEIDAVLRTQEPAPGRKKPSEAQTSARRAKSMRPEQMAVLVSVLLIDPTPIRAIAAAMLEHGAELATRPGEFLSLFEQDGSFLVHSGKYSESNRRGLEPFRHVPTDSYEPWQIEELRYIIGLIDAELENGSTIENLLRRCQAAIRTARAQTEGHAARVAGYTARHQARANLVAMGMAPEEVAVVMGHASAGTAQSHYAPARRAWKGASSRTPPAVDPALVAKVRPAHPSRGWNRDRNNGHRLI